LLTHSLKYPCYFTENEGARQGGLPLFDAFQNSILNVYIRKVERVDGRPVNKVLDTLREVEQYWPKGKPRP